MAYHAEFGRSRSIYMRISRGCRKFSVRWGRRPPWDAYVGRCAGKKLGPRVPTFKVTQGHRTDTDRSDTYEFYSNHGPILYRFLDIARYWPTIANFSNLTPIERLRRWVALELG